LNTPQSSPSKTFHGMPLRVLLGEGDPDILGKCSSMVRPEQVFMVAVRDIDPPEREFIRGNDLPIFGELKFNALYPPLASAIRAAGLHNVYIHLDLDVLDPREFPYLLFPTSHGLAGATLLTLIDALRRDFTCVGFSIVEYDAHIQWHDTLPDLLRNIADVFADTARNHDQK
jgi:arginase